MRQETVNPDVLRFYDMIAEIDPKVIKAGCFKDTFSDGTVIRYYFCFKLQGKDNLVLEDAIKPNIFEFYVIDDDGNKIFGFDTLLNADLELYRERLYNRIYYEYNDHNMPDDENSYSNNRPANLKPYIDN